MQPTDREKKRLEISMAKMQLLLDELAARCNCTADAEGKVLVMQELQLYVGALSLCATAARASATWGYLLGATASEFYAALSESSRFLGRLKDVYAAGERAGIIKLDIAGYPCTVAALPLGASLCFAREGPEERAGVSVTMVEVPLQPRFAAAGLLEQYAGFLRYYLAESSASSSSSDTQGISSGASTVAVPSLEARSFALTCIHEWFARGTACVDIDALAAVVAEGVDNAEAGAGGSDAIDAVNRINDISTLAEELVLAACPAAPWSCSAGENGAPAWSAKDLITPLDSSGDIGAVGVSIETLDHVALYLDVQRALAPLLRLGVCCDQIQTPEGVAAVWRANGGATCVPPSMLRPLGLGAAGIAQCLLAARAAGAVIKAVPESLPLVLACSGSTEYGSGQSAVTDLLEHCRNTAQGPIVNSVWIESAVSATAAQVDQLTTWAALNGTPPTPAALRTYIGILAALAASASVVGSDATIETRARLAAAVQHATSGSGVAALRLSYGLNLAHATGYLLAPLESCEPRGNIGLHSIASAVLAAEAPLAAHVFAACAEMLKPSGTATRGGKGVASMDRSPLTVVNASSQ